MTKEEITIPIWFLERIEDTLRIQYNINLDKKTGETCQDRNIKECLNGVRKLLKGEELTGGERLERLQPSLPSDLDEAAEEYLLEGSIPYFKEGFPGERVVAAFKYGAEWMAGQGYIQEGIARPDDDEIWVNMKNTDIKDGDKVVVQIRKK